MFNITIKEFKALLSNNLYDAVENLFQGVERVIDEHSRQHQTIMVEDGVVMRYRHMYWDRDGKMYLPCTGTNGKWKYNQ